MKYSQTNTEPSYTPRKLTGGLTQKSAQPEAQNSAGTWHGEVNLGSERRGKEVILRAERRRRLGVGGEYGKSTPPQKQLEESGKLDTAAGTKLKREKGERRGFNLN